MNLYIAIPYSGVIHSYRFLPTDFQVIDLPDVVHLEIFKEHNHSYYFAAFSYRTRLICFPKYFRSKKDLYAGVQFFLQQELSDVGQKD